ncbi:MAG: NPCBM/NEW2 domain-containing protein, partial [Kiritimatiellae bacterium]|nr:NPCBM/NEW2 domain-containing protein [Kiritimatiellia bacterium]
MSGREIMGRFGLAAAALALTAAGAFAAETAVVRGGEKAVAIAERVEGAEEVKLTVTVGPDTYDFDQAIWCAPVFVLKDGSRVDATTLPLRGRAAGWGEVEVNRVAWSKAASAAVGGEHFTRFISAHAPSHVILPVPLGAVRFEARGGLTAPTGKGSCTFRVETGEFTRRERAMRLKARAEGDLAALERLAAHR